MPREARRFRTFGGTFAPGKAPGTFGDQFRLGYDSSSRAEAARRHYEQKPTLVFQEQPLLMQSTL
jgi:hypothetical protein